jgi:xylan 1,4-beta-xylosidase
VSAPPQDYNEWYALVKATLDHAIERYTLAEVQTWEFEVWNGEVFEVFC